MLRRTSIYVPHMLRVLWGGLAELGELTIAAAAFIALLGSRSAPPFRLLLPSPPPPLVSTLFPTGSPTIGQQEGRPSPARLHPIGSHECGADGGRYVSLRTAEFHAIVPLSFAQPAPAPPPPPSPAHDATVRFAAAAQPAASAAAPLSADPTPVLRRLFPFLRHPLAPVRLAAVTILLRLLVPASECAHVGAAATTTPTLMERLSAEGVLQAVRGRKGMGGARF